MKNTDTPSIERLKELIQTANEAEAERIRVHGLYNEDYSVEAEEKCMQAYRDARDAKGELAHEAINALPHLIATLETLPSAGEGVEPIVGEGSEYKTLKDFCDALFREEDERKLDTLIGEAVTIMQALAAENARLSALASIPLEQPDIEGRAREPSEAAYRDAVALADALWRAHYREQAPHWKPLPDLCGVISQIDNMTAGLTSLPTTEIRREAK